ncbi:MAG: endonuclease/exonuclease/phosphatase family protein, partial [Bacteroidales bacterium]|nr:endonuclease/exonuclease/phosphatase family protein [Bacteroidales bacterium]
MKTRLLLFIAFLLFSALTYAQNVTPNNRVHTHLNVRDMPSGNVIGNLEPGETAPLLTDTVPYWYMILYNADTGYVHKSWSEIIQAGNEQGDLVIGSWNVKNFATCSRDTLYYRALADVISTFDVITLQEVSSNVCPRHFDSIVDVLTAMSMNYDYLFTDRTGYSSNNPHPDKKVYYERFGFFWNTDRVELLDENDPYSFICTPLIDNEIFRQVPATAYFKVNRENGFDFQIVSVHTPYNEKLEEVRADEFRYIHQWLNRQVDDPAVEEKNIFVMGDFNANPDGQNNYFDTIITPDTEYRVIMKEPRLAGENSIKTTILIPASGDPADHHLPVYDHILLTRLTSYAIPHDTLTWASGLIGVIEFDQEQRWQD